MYSVKGHCNKIAVLSAPGQAISRGRQVPPITAATASLYVIAILTVFITLNGECRVLAVCPPEPYRHTTYLC
jgi:hypothetical protein